MGKQLTVIDKNELNTNFPTLNCNLESSLVWGTLAFECSYNKNTHRIYYDNSQGESISDDYEIRIDFSKTDEFGFPLVYEESQIIKNYAITKKINLSDLHIDLDNACCLGIFPEYEWKGAVPFIVEQVIPYFYWQSYFRLHNKAPWKGYAHGNEGLVEYRELRNKEAKHNKGRYRNKLCPCGSGLKFKKCCRLS